MSVQHRFHGIIYICFRCYFFWFRVCMYVCTQYVLYCKSIHTAEAYSQFSTIFRFFLSFVPFTLLLQLLLLWDILARSMFFSSFQHVIVFDVHNEPYLRLRIQLAFVYYRYCLEFTGWKTFHSSLSVLIHWILFLLKKLTVSDLLGKRKDFRYFAHVPLEKVFILKLPAFHLNAKTSTKTTKEKIPMFDRFLRSSTEYE